jgi:hypothetical protein
LKYKGGAIFVAVDTQKKHKERSGSRADRFPSPKRSRRPSSTAQRSCTAMRDRTVQPDPQSVKSEKRLITDPELRRRLGNISAVTLWRLRKSDPRCPKPVRMFAHNNLVPEEEADRYIDLLCAEREAGAA